LEDTYRINRNDATVVYLPRIALKLVPNSEPQSAFGLRLDEFRQGLAGFARLYPGEAELLASLPADSVLLPSSHEFSFIAIDRSHVSDNGRAQTIDLRFRFIAEGWLLLAVDESLLARSPPLAAYDTGAIGAFSFGINRFPVIRAGDTVTLVENVSSIEFFPPPHEDPNINSIKPFGVGSRRLKFPIPGEYYLRINRRFPIKILVIERDSTKAESDRLISAFVASNSIVAPSDGIQHPRGEAPFDASHFFESETPTRMGRASMLELNALLETSANASRPR
jgi:hypothetical protein